MAGASGRRESRERIKAEAQAKRDAVQQTSPENAAKEGATLTPEQSAAASDFQRAFAKEIGFEPSLFSKIWNGKEGLADKIRDHIKENVTPNEFLDGLAKADPQYAGLATKIQAHPELAKALHSAVAENPSVIPGLTAVANNNTGEGMTLGKVENAIDNPLTRKLMVGQLNSLAKNPEKDFTATLAAASDGFGKFFENGWDGFLEHLKNPAEMIDMIMEQMDGLPPELQDFMRGVMSGMLPVMADVLDYEDGLYSDFYKVGQQGWEQGKAAGIQQRADAAAIKADDTLKGGEGSDTILGGEGNGTLGVANYDISPSEVAISKDQFDKGGDLTGTELAINLKADEPPRSVMAETTFVTAASATQVMQPAETQSIVADNINRNTMALTA